MAFFLERVGSVGLAQDREFFRDDFPLLALPFRSDEFAVHFDRGAGVRAGDLRRVVRQGSIRDDLDAFKRRAVAARADPALQQDRVHGRGRVERIFDQCA